MSAERGYKFIQRGRLAQWFVLKRYRFKRKLKELKSGAKNFVKMLRLALKRALNTPQWIIDWTGDNGESLKFEFYGDGRATVFDHTRWTLEIEEIDWKVEGGAVHVRIKEHQDWRLVDSKWSHKYDSYLARRMLE